MGLAVPEISVVEAIRARLGTAPPGEVWIGDDAAVLVPPEGRLLVTTDVVVEGVHAEVGLVGLDDLGWKAMACSLSDVAAMGGIPWRAVVSLVAPSGTDIDRLYDGLAGASTRYRCPIVGGDLSGGTRIVVCVTVTGTTGGSEPVLRRGAAPGDAVFVTGPLGGSAAGLRLLRSGKGDGGALALSYRRPVARVDEGRAALAGGATAMIDVSDGLALDAGRLASASRVGLVLEEVPVAPGATVDEALGGGEDYELVFTARDPVRAGESFGSRGLRKPVLIGRCTSDPHERRLGEGLLEPSGWLHDF